MLKTNLIAAACLCLFNLQTVNAQGVPAAADVLRNIEQNKTDPLQQPQRAVKKPMAPATTDQGFARLKEINIQSPMLQKELMDFWATEINKPVPAQKLSEFKAYAWDLFQSKGYLAYITTSAQPTSEGSVLTVNVTLPSIAKVSVVMVSGNRGEEFSAEVLRRFNNIYKPGAPLDVQGIENQLNAASYDLPVELEVSLRQVNSTQVDVVINLRQVDAQLGSILGGFLQVNNYGLGQFGHNQILGNVRIAGFTPSSELTLTAQQSIGVNYYRADYEAPIQGSLMRWRMYASQVQSQANNVKGWTDEAGAGLTKLLDTDRIGRWLSGAEISRRQTQNWASDALTQDRVDQQVRLKLRAESSKGWVDSFNNELVLTMGRMNLDRLAGDKSADTLAANVAGFYKKVEMTGSLSNALDADALYMGSVRWRAQAADKNLDAYSRLSVGGLNGIRAYTTLDGVGDQGVQTSVEITRQLNSRMWMGPFYDIGVVKVNHVAIQNSPDSAYLLQGAGLQLGGNVYETNWNLSLAKSFGKTPESWTSANTRVGSYRLNASLTRAF